MGERLNHRERKRRERAAATRRRFLIGGVTAIGALSLAALAGNKLFSGSGDTDFAKFLNDLDKRTAGPNGASLLLLKQGEIDERTTNALEEYLGFKVPIIKGRVRFFSRVEGLLNAVDQANVCATPVPTVGLPRGATTMQNEQPNLSMVLLSSETPNPATQAAETTIHEKLHLLMKGRRFVYPGDMTPFLDPNLEYISMYGLAAMYYPRDVSERNNCTIKSHRGPLQEANTQYSTLAVLSKSGVKLGPGGFVSTAYGTWTNIYSQGIAVHFPNDHRDQLLFPVLESDPRKFFSNLGRRIDPRSDDPSVIGERHSKRMFEI